MVSGVLDSMKREEAEDYVKRHGGKVGGRWGDRISMLHCAHSFQLRQAPRQAGEWVMMAGCICCCGSQCTTAFSTCSALPVRT